MTTKLNRSVRIRRAASRLKQKILPMQYEVHRSGRVIQQFRTFKEADAFASMENMGSDMYTSTVRKIVS